MSKWGGPVNPYITLGGFIPKGESFPEAPEYHKVQLRKRYFSANRLPQIFFQKK
jgi:hypothetical protein